MSQDRVQMSCGKYQVKSSASRHRKSCISCKLVETLRKEICYLQDEKESMQLLLKNCIKKKNRLKKQKSPTKNSVKKTENDVHDVKISNEKTDGFLYLLQVRESIRMNDNVFKVGKCENIVKRFKQYPKGSKLLKYIQVPNRHISEGLLLKIMGDTYEVAKSYGNEYFHGDLNEILKTFEEFFKIGTLPQ